jgi:hypothetical protein
MRRYTRRRYLKPQLVGLVFVHGLPADVTARQRSGPRGLVGAVGFTSLDGLAGARPSRWGAAWVPRVIGRQRSRAGSLERRLVNGNANSAN